MSSDSDDDSYYDRLQAAVPNESSAEGSMSQAQQLPHEPPQPVDDEDSYFERIHTHNTINSLFLPETDPVWNRISTSLSKEGKAPEQQVSDVSPVCLPGLAVNESTIPHRILVSGSDLTRIRSHNDASPDKS